MALNFTKEKVLVTTIEQTLYTVPATKTALIIGFMAGNISGGLQNVTYKCADTQIGTNLPVPTGSILPLVDGKVVLNEGETVKVTSSDDTSINVYLSILEL